MTIVGCDFHPAWQQVAVLDTETGEIRELKLENGNGEAERFYRQLGSPALIGFEAVATRSGLRICWIDWDMKCGWEMQPPSEPATCASRRRTVGMQRTS